MMRITKLMAVGMLTLSSPALAWSPEGHALIGKIADQLLGGTKTGAMFYAILESYKLEDAARWVDCVRSVHKEISGEFRYQTNRYTGPCKAFETPEEIARMEDFARRNWNNFSSGRGHTDQEPYLFADIPIEEGSYDESSIGASEHDVVHAANAAIEELDGKPVSAPFSIKDDKEATLLLAHLIGDLHQPLHVGTIYLDQAGHEAAPHSPAEADANDTADGRFIEVGSRNLLHEWDEIPEILSHESIEELARKALSSPPDFGMPELWPEMWAGESVRAAATAYRDISFVPDGLHKWRAEFQDRKAYLAAEHSEQEARVIQAGLRLAELLRTIWALRAMPPQPH